MRFVVCKRCANISFECFTNDYYSYSAAVRLFWATNSIITRQQNGLQKRRGRRRSSHTAIVWLLLDWNVWYAKTQNVSSSKTLKNMYITRCIVIGFNSISIKVTLLFLLAFESEAGICVHNLTFHYTKTDPMNDCALHTAHPVQRRDSYGFFFISVVSLLINMVTCAIILISTIHTHANQKNPKNQKRRTQNIYRS